jgi:hypothetical protein
MLVVKSALHQMTLVFEPRVPKCWKQCTGLFADTLTENK